MTSDCFLSLLRKMLLRYVLQKLDAEYNDVKDDKLRLQASLSDRSCPFPCLRNEMPIKATKIRPEHLPTD